MPKISVIIPTYNSASFLPEAIESVLAQTYKDFEIIVIDDGSTDNTKEVVTPYLDRIILLEIPNGGPSKARNHGIRKSSGEYVAFLDADDIWYPDKLECQLAFFSKNQHYDLVFSDAHNTSIDNPQKDRLFFNGIRRLKAGWAFSELLAQNFILIPSVIVKRTCLESAGLFDEKLICWEGYDLWLRIAFKHQIGFVNAPLFIRRVRENSTFFISRLNEITSLITIMEKWDNDALRLAEADRKTINQRFSGNYRRLGKYYLAHGCHDKARRALKKSIARGSTAKGIVYFGLSMFPALVIQPILNAQKYLILMTSRISNMQDRKGWFNTNRAIDKRNGD